MLGMEPGLILSLVGLALVDSTSIGTLVIPIWLLLAPGRPPLARLVGYLATIAGFYFLVGVAIVSGAGALAEPLGRVFETRTALYVQLALGVALFGWSFRFDPKKRRPGSPGRLEKWRARVTEPGSDRSSAWWLLGLALTAGLMEVATMLPYLGAIGLLTTSGVDWPERGVVLAGYCLVMIVPALVLLAARVLAAEKVRSPLERLNGWFAKHATSTTGWVLGIAGFLIARDAAARLWFF